MPIVQDVLMGVAQNVLLERVNTTTAKVIVKGDAIRILDKNKFYKKYPFLS